MHQFEVWAPQAGRMTLDFRGQSVAMRRDDAGWWRAEVDCESHGVDYAYCIDGGQPLPDPRSPWQPQGVHGFSRLLDHSRFRWRDAGFQPVPMDAAVIYELHVGTFTPAGTFEAVIDKLDYLRNLGITHLELMPVVEFGGGRGWGYDGVDLFAPHHAYGGPDGLKTLVNACHAAGLAVIIDVVYNHFGPEGGYATKFGPYLTEQHRSPWGQAVNLDSQYSSEVRQFFCDNATMWLRDYHADALRVDAVHAFIDLSAVHFLEELGQAVHRLRGRLGRHVFVIAESDLNDPRVIEPVAAGGHGLDAQWADDFHHAVHALLTGQRDGYYADFGRLADLAKAMTRVFVYDGQYSRFRRRRHGRPIRAADGRNFVVCIQNHDQVGNRAGGERLGQLVSQRQARLAATMLLTAPCIPLLFAGEEWNAASPFQYFTSFQDEQLATAVRDGRAREFAQFDWQADSIPDPQAEQTFLQSKLDWSEPASHPHASMLKWYRELIRLRRDWPELREPRLAETAVVFDEDARWMVMTRGRITVAFNLAGQPQAVQLASPPAGRRVLLASEPDSEGFRPDQINDRLRTCTTRIELPAESALILGP